MEVKGGVTAIIFSFALFNEFDRPDVAKSNRLVSCPTKIPGQGDRGSFVVDDEIIGARNQPQSEGEEDKARGSEDSSPTERDVPERGRSFAASSNDDEGGDGG